MRILFAILVTVAMQRSFGQSSNDLQINGNFIVETGTHPYFFTSTSSEEMNRYVFLLNSPSHHSASGLKAGGILVSDSYSFADPAKNDLIVKGNIGIGTANPATTLDVRGNVTMETGDNPYLYTSNTNAEMGRYLFLLNSPTHQSASGLKAGGILVSDSYSYGYPGKNDLIVKGKIGIGTANLTDDNYRLFVETGIRTRKIKVDQQAWADYVFQPSYKLRSLDSLKKYVRINRRLPDVPSAQTVLKEGTDLAETQALLLKKVEELTLYVLQLRDVNKEQGKKLEYLQLAYGKLQSRISSTGR